MASVMLDHGYLPSRTASLLLDQYQLIQLGDRGTSGEQLE